MSLCKSPTVATIKALRCAVSSLGGQPLSYKQGWQRLLTGYREMPKALSRLGLQRHPNEGRGAPILVQ